MKRKPKALAQLEMFSTAWDREMEKLKPGWSVEHATEGVIKGRFAISAKRVERLSGQKGGPGPLLDLDFV